MASRANQITTNCINHANLQGHTVFRNNVTGVFDLKIALGKIHELINWNRIFKEGKLDEFIKVNIHLVKALKESYRKSHEKIGASDILGFSKNGRFIAIEIKGKGDDFKIEQQQFLKEVGDKGGIALCVAEEPEKIRAKVNLWGFDKSVLICSEDEFHEVLKKMMTL